MRVWLRRGHRWMGLAAVFFVLVLSVTGIALNHSSDWELDRRYVTWPWLTSALGVSAPEPAASFADRGHRIIQLGRRAYFDSRDISREVESVKGLVTLDDFALVATQTAVLLLTLEGDLVENIDLTNDLPGPVDRIGIVNGRPLLDSGGLLFIGDRDVTAFTPWEAGGDAAITWSTASDPAASELSVVRDLYRGRGVSIERLLIEVHSGRIVATAGPWLLDLVAVGLIVLSISGVVVWLRGAGRGNGAQNGRRTP